MAAIGDFFTSDALSSSGEARRRRQGKRHMKRKRSDTANARNVRQEVYWVVPEGDGTYKTIMKVPPHIPTLHGDDGNTRACPRNPHLTAQTK